MKELIINNTTIVFEQNENGVFTDSRTIANVFKNGATNKDAHGNVLKAIKDVAEEEDYRLVKIYESSYINTQIDNSTP